MGEHLHAPAVLALKHFKLLRQAWVSKSQSWLCATPHYTWPCMGRGKHQLKEIQPISIAVAIRRWIPIMGYYLKPCETSPDAMSVLHYRDFCFFPTAAVRRSGQHVLQGWAGNHCHCSILPLTQALLKCFKAVLFPFLRRQDTWAT